jgi:hypothetical protein
MSDAIEVELSGEDDSSPDGPGIGGGRGVWLLVGVGLGFAFALLFSNAVPDAQPTSPGGVTATTLAPGSGVGDVIPGYPDGMNILVAPGGGRALEVLTWPLQGEPIYRSVPLGDIDLAATAHFDASGQFLAAATSTPDGLILSSGRPNTYRVIASGITGFAWHDSAPADLAWSTVDDGELRIWISDDAGPGELAVSAVGFGTHLVAFGDWGYAVSDGGGVDYVLDPSGELIGSITGRVVTSHGSGLLLVSDADGASIVATDDLAILFEVARDVLESLFDFEAAGLDPPALPVIGAEFSPDGERVAMTGPAGLTVAEFGEVLEAESFPIRGASDSLSWSSDGRFVLVSVFQGVAVLDTEIGEISSILENEITRSVAATPIGGP